MNATKWREAAETMRQLPGGPPRFRMKDIDAEYITEWDREWYYHPRPFETLEWLEIDPDSRGEQVLSALLAVGIRPEKTGELIRIVGWIRPAEPKPDQH